MSTFYIQKEDKTAYLALGGIVNAVTHFKITQLRSNLLYQLADCDRHEHVNDVATANVEGGRIHLQQIKRSLLSKWPLYIELVVLLLFSVI